MVQIELRGKLDPILSCEIEISCKHMSDYHGYVMKNGKFLESLTRCIKNLLIFPGIRIKLQTLFLPILT